MRNCVQAPSINWAEAQRSRAGPGGYLGVTSVPVPSPPSAAAPAPAAEAAAERRRQSDLVQVRALRHRPSPQPVSSPTNQALALRPSPLLEPPPQAPCRSFCTVEQKNLSSSWWYMRVWCAPGQLGNEERRHWRC